jgi:hypothetical protein
VRLELSLPGYGACDLSYPPFLPSPPSRSVQAQDRAWYFYLAEIALRRLSNQILTRILYFVQDGVFERLDELNSWTQAFESQAEEWFVAPMQTQCTLD